MPRKGRGGSRQGTPGTAYSNRTDLNMPISTVPNQEYGKAAQQQAAQRSVPMGASPVSAGDSGQGQQTQAPMQPRQMGQPLPQPGSMPYISPTNRPNEPITSGLPFGPGPNDTQPPRPMISRQLSLAADASGSDTAAAIAAAARAMGL